jgi:hypothetical protein
LTLVANDIVDFFHCVVPVANSDLVLIDKTWTKLVQGIGLPATRVRVYYEADLAKFMDDLRFGVVST